MPPLSSKLASLLVFAGAAVLEVGGDALVRRGLRGGGFAFCALGVLLLGGYSVAVNSVDLDFSRLLGAYVGIFALVSVLVGRLVFHDRIPGATWLGLAVVLCGSLIIQFAGRR